MEDRSQLKKFVGPPLRTSFEESLGYSPEDADKAIGFYREYYHGKGGFFGYGDEPELTTAGATFLANSAEDILNLIMN